MCTEHTSVSCEKLYVVANDVLRLWASELASGARQKTRKNVAELCTCTRQWSTFSNLWRSCRLLALFLFSSTLGGRSRLSINYLQMLGDTLKRQGSNSWKLDRAEIDLSVFIADERLEIHKTNVARLGKPTYLSATSS
jgi:hypothetical protein